MCWQRYGINTTLYCAVNRLFMGFGNFSCHYSPRTRINNCNDQTHKSIFRVRFTKASTRKNAYLHIIYLSSIIKMDFIMSLLNIQHTYREHVTFTWRIMCVVLNHKMCLLIRCLYANIDWTECRNSIRTHVLAVYFLYITWIFAIRINMRHNIILCIRIVLI